MISSGIFSSIVRKTSSNIVLFAMRHPFRGCYVSFAFVLFNLIFYNLLYSADFCVLIMFSFQMYSYFRMFNICGTLSFVQSKSIFVSDHLLCTLYRVFYFNRRTITFPANPLNKKSPGNTVLLTVLSGVFVYLLIYYWCAYNRKLIISFWQ